MTLTKEQWIERLDLAEPALLTACEFFCIPSDERRFRTHHAIIKGYSMLIGLDFQENQWISACIIGFPNDYIHNPESLFLKECNEKGKSS